MAKITFTNKQDLISSGFPEVNKITAIDINAIKSVVNLNDDAKTEKGGYVGTSNDLKNAIDNAVFSGLITYQTEAELLAVSPIPSDGTPAKVANNVADPTKNGNWSVVSGAWLQDASVVSNISNSVDIKTVGDELQFNNRDKTLDSLGYKYIRSDFDFTAIPVGYDNSIWEISNFHDLLTNTIILPLNVTLKFNGGKLSNGNLTGNNTLIDFKNNEFFSSNLLTLGSFKSNDKNLFESVDVFKLLSLPNGFTFSTESYYSSLDGGNADYKVVLSSEYLGTVDEYGDHTLSNGNIAVLQSKTASSKQFGARDGIESGIHIQSMFNWCAKSTNTSDCILGHSEERFKISKSLVLSSRHSGLNFSCKNAWLDVIQGTVSTSALRIMIGEYDAGFTYFPGDALGTTVKDISIDVLNIMSDAPVEEKAIFYLDDVSLLPVNGGNSATYTTAHSNFQNWFLNNGYSTGGVEAAYSPSLDSSTIDLSIDFFKNIKINTCNFVDVARSGFRLGAKSDDFNIGTITQNGCIYHPLSTVIPAFFATNVDFIINLNVGDINVENTNSIFDFSSDTKDQTIPHGYINIEKAIGRKIRGRTKTHGNYHEISIGLLDSQQQTGGESLGNWAALSFLESQKLFIDKIINRSASYSNANGVLYIGDTNNAYGNREVLINDSISYLPEINSIPYQSIFYDQNSDIISFTNKYTIKNIEVFGVLPIVSNTLKGSVNIGNISVYSSSVSNRVLSNPLINNTSLFLSISRLYVDFLTFENTTTSLISSVNDSNAPLKVVSIGDIIIADATGVDTGVLMNASAQMPDISIGSVITPEALSLRAIARALSADTNRCGILMVSNSMTDAGFKYPIENPEYLVFAKNQFITGQAKPALVWWDSQNLALKYNLDRPTSEVNGTNV